MRLPSIPGLGLGRIVLAQVLEWLVRVGNGAGLAGIFFGAGESMLGHARDYALAIPNGFRALGHYLHGGRHIDQLARTVQYLNEEAPSIEEIRSTAAGARSWLNRFDLARGSIREGLQELADAELILGIGDVRWGLTNMPPRAELDTIMERSRAIVDPAVGYLTEVRLDPLLQAVANASDNLAADEVVGTVTMMVVLGMGVWLAGSWAITMWVRRGLPSLLARVWMRAGTRTYADWYRRHGRDVANALGLTAPDGAPPVERDQE